MTSLKTRYTQLQEKIIQLKQAGSLSFGINVYRSLLALSTMTVFIFNFDTMYDIFSFGQNPFHLQYLKYDIFSVFGFYLGYILSFVILLAVISGYLPQLTSILQFYVQASFILHYPNMSDGGDYIITIVLFLLIFSFVTDRRLNSWRKPKQAQLDRGFFRPSVYMNYRAIRLFICLIYFHAAVSKFHVTEWYNGTAIYYFLNDPLSGNAGLLDNALFRSIIQNPILITLISWGALLTEVHIAFMLYVRNYKTRRNVFILGCLLHLAIIPLFFIPMFSFRMIASLYFYLLVKPDPDEVTT